MTTTTPWPALALLLLATPVGRAADHLVPGSWGNIGKILASDGGYGDNFGTAVSISGDTLLIGAPYHDWTGGNSGAAYVYVKTASGWNLQAELGGGVTVAGDTFGYSVCLSGDRAVVGAPRHVVPTGTPGAAHVYERTGSVWTHQAELISSGVMGGDDFGFAVTLHGDTLVVGARYENAGASIAGAAYVFRWNGSSWIEEARLTPYPPHYYGRFGCSVSLSGETLLVGEDWYQGLGTAHVFERAGTTWTETAALMGDDSESGDMFGCSVCLDGDTALVGAIRDDAPDHYSGSAYVLVRSGASWVQQAKLVSSAPGSSYYFGCSVSLDGDLAVIGEDNGFNVGAYAGVVHVYERSGSSWAFQDRILAGDAAHSDFFGDSVQVEGKAVVIGAPGDGDLDGEGSAYVFRRLGPPGELYCFGDRGSGTPCPCNNDNDGSTPESGCANGVFTAGARLTGGGVASVTGDSLVLVCIRQEPLQSGLYFQGNSDTSPALVWGDGLQCAGGYLVRLQVRQADAGGASSTTIGIAAKAGNVSAGTVKYYQCWYRNPTGSPCGYGFNTSNGYAVCWAP